MVQYGVAAVPGPESEQTELVLSTYSDTVAAAATEGNASRPAGTKRTADTPSILVSLMLPKLEVPPSRWHRTNDVLVPHRRMRLFRSPRRRALHRFRCQRPQVGALMGGQQGALRIIPLCAG